MNVAVALNRGYVVGAQDTVEAQIAVGPQARHQVGRAVVVPGFLEQFHRAAHVAHVHEEDFLLLAEMPDHSR